VRRLKEKALIIMRGSSASSAGVTPDVVERRERLILAAMLPSQCPPNQIHLEQVGTTWKVVQRNQPIEDFGTFAEAMARAGDIVRGLIGDGHKDTLAVIVTPPASPWMRE
jgi:hypothetical protein